MQHIKTGASRKTFDLLAKTRSAQAAMMILRPGGESDETPTNEHPKCEQWLLVISGSGEAIIGKNRTSLRRVLLVEGSLLLVEKGELHQIRNTGRRTMRTINFYIPPAYDSEGDPL
jgi:mannose-6-phosphate isomerase-like protein (cupin superfamily)